MSASNARPLCQIQVVSPCVCVFVDLLVCLFSAPDHLHKEEASSPSASDPVPMCTYVLYLVAVSMAESGVMEKLH